MMRYQDMVSYKTLSLFYRALLQKRPMILRSLLIVHIHAITCTYTSSTLCHGISYKTLSSTLYTMTVELTYHVTVYRISLPPFWQIFCLYICACTYIYVGVYIFTYSSCPPFAARASHPTGMTAIYHPI